MADPFIKLYKKLLKWEWYDDNNTKILFIHCLLKANWEQTKWHGLTIEAGQFVTSLETLVNETHLSTQEVRTAIKHLISTGEITSKAHSKYRVITLVKWSDYQATNKQANKETTSNQQTANKQLTTVKEYKEEEEEKELKDKKNIYGEYRHVRLTDPEKDKLVSEFGELETNEAIKFLDEYIEMKGYKAKSHYLAMRKWVFNAVKEDRARKKPKQETNIYDAWANA
jgi:hypothetical protein